MDVDNEVTKHMFLQGPYDLASSANNPAFDHPNCSDVVFLNLAETEILIDRRTINIPHKEAESEVSVVRDSSGLAGSQVRNVEGNYCNMPPRQDTNEVINDCFVKYEEPQKLLYEKGNAKSLEGNSHMSDNIESRKSEDLKMQKDARLCLVAGCDNTGTNGTTQATINNSDLTVSRDVISEQLRAKVDENTDLSDFQKERLYALLSKYRSHLMKRPGRCNQFKYKFEMTGDMPKSRNARPIPFALRAQVKERIQEMLKGNNLEESFSDYVNPLTLVERPGKGIRICIDACRVNALMIPDRVKVDPMKELLQRFHGSKFITTTDLSSAFLQVPLHRSSRKWTSFQFGNQVYQYKVVSYGFKNSLSAFIRALDKVLEDDLVDNVVNYVDDVAMHSGCFEDHLRHLETVLEKLTTAGFTINANKCSFCKPQIKFLGHVISSKALMPDTDRIKAIRSYPPPRNQKQLRRFLGICNFHQQLTPNYTHFVSPLLILLKKGHKWKWASDL